jgi:NAD-dependent deacetylase
LKRRAGKWFKKKRNVVLVKILKTKKYMKKKLVVLTGAGISAESGIKTFRDSDGLWEGHNVMDVATPDGWQRNPALVLDFYNKRRKQLHEVLPNLGHEILAELENDFDVHIITQNVDNLHEKAGSTKILHLHGELLKVRSTNNNNYILDWQEDLNFGDFDDQGNQLRPHIVWFGEDVPALEKALQIVEKADILIIIGTSLQVYPAASLMNYANPTIPVYYIDPNPAIISSLPNPLKIIEAVASKGMKTVQKELNKLL